jgi:hypothetical protein
MKAKVREFIDNYYGPGCPPYTWPLTITPIVLSLFHINGVVNAIIFLSGLCFGLLCATMIYLHNH